MPRLKQVASTCQAPEKLLDPAWPTESNPLTFPGPGRRQICMGGRARSVPSIPRVGLSKCRGGRWVGIDGMELAGLPRTFQGVAKTGPHVLSPPWSSHHHALTHHALAVILPGPYSQGHALITMLSPLYSRRLALTTMLSGPCSQGHALTAMLSRQGSRVCLRAGSRGRLTGRLTCMLIYRLHR
jgi:hypothetical protein